MPVVGKWNKSTWMTYSAIISATLSMFFALINRNFALAHLFLLLSGVLDMFDGYVARKCKRTKQDKLYGIQLDSLADTVSFVATPVVIAFSLGVKEWYEVAMLAFFMVCGVARLAFFNIIAETTDGPVKYYRGLPVTFSGFLLPLSYITFVKFLPIQIISMMYVAVMAIIAILNILDFKMTKPKPALYGVFSAIAILIAVLLFL